MLAEWSPSGLLVVEVQNEHPDAMYEGSGVVNKTDGVYPRARKELCRFERRGWWKNEAPSNSPEADRGESICRRWWEKISIGGFHAHQVVRNLRHAGDGIHGDFVDISDQSLGVQFE